jgi:hypothetical protein
MDSSKKIINAFLSILLIGIITTPLTLISPSETSSAFWLGVSKERLLVFAIQFLTLILISWLFASGSQKKFSSPFYTRVKTFFSNPTRFQMIRNILLGTAIFLSFAFFYFSVFIPQALSAYSGWLAFSAWTTYRLFIKLVPLPADFQPVRFRTLFPSWKTLTSNQKRTTLALLAIGVIYFCIFIPINLRESGSLNELELDEMVTYPVLVKMLSDQPTLRLFLHQFFDYGAYIYGFPFFGGSAALLLPGKLIFGQGFADQLQLNMLLLRQLINVLPAVLACFLFTYLTTHFMRFWASTLIYLILLTLPGVVLVNNTFWHPDMLNLFFIALALYYLDRDQLRFGVHFYFGAIAIGLSAATRLFGLLFFLAIAHLLVTGVVKKIMAIKKAFLTGILFITLMIGTILVANPYLFSPGEPAAALRSFTRQGETLAHGVQEADPENIYRTGIDAWWPFMTQFYGSGVLLITLGISTLAGCFGRHRSHFYRMLFAWLLVIGTYLIGFVAVKSSWYLLPFLIPLYCSGLALPENLAGVMEKWKLNPRGATLLRTVVAVLFFGLGIFQLVENLKIIF